MTTTVDSPDTDTTEDPASVPPPARRRGRGWRALVWTGWVLIGIGIFLLLFVAYLLWGTRIHTARAQAKMQTELADGNASILADLGAEVTREALLDALDAQRSSAEADGGPVARIVIPKIGLDAIVVAGTDTEDLEKGPGSMDITAAPGAPGNAVVSGHRVTYGAEFHRLDELVPGDEIIIETVAGRTTYRVHSNTDPIRLTIPTESGEETFDVHGSQVVDHDSLESKESAARHFTAQTGPSRITLTTCNPKFSARQRLVVVADMVAGPFAGEEPGP